MRVENAPQQLKPESLPAVPEQDARFVDSILQRSIITAQTILHEALRPNSAVLDAFSIHSHRIVAELQDHFCELQSQLQSYNDLAALLERLSIRTPPLNFRAPPGQWLRAFLAEA